MISTIVEFISTKEVEPDDNFELIVAQDIFAVGGWDWGGCEVVTGQGRCGPGILVKIHTHVKCSSASCDILGPFGKRVVITKAIQQAPFVS